MVEQPSQTPSSQGGGGYGGGRMNKRRPTVTPPNKQRTVPPNKKFEGKTDDIKNDVYDTSESRQADQFLRTTKAVAEGKDVKDGALVTTVKEKEHNYSDRDVTRARFARKTQDMIGRPSVREFIRIIANNSLPNCPVTIEDIKTAEDIFGPNLGSLKGKTPRRAGEPVTVAPLLPLPIEIMDRYRAIILAIDIMFVNKIPFFMSISRNLRFGTAERIGNRQASTLSTAVRHIHQVYLKRGFQITTVLQGYDVGPSTVYQDNQSAMLLEKNGLASSSKRTRHIDIRYYFVADRIANGDVTVEYCPTTEMTADFFTKPLQGAAFHKFRRAILGLKD